MSPTGEEIVRAVRAYAKVNYNLGGWDYVVECFEDADILRVAGTATTIDEAIALVGKDVKIKDDYRRDVQAEIF